MASEVNSADSDGTGSAEETNASDGGSTAGATRPTEVRTADGSIVHYDDLAGRMFAVAAIGWGIAATLVGMFVAFLLLKPELFNGAEAVSFGRLRPLHTTIGLYAFVGNALFALVHYSTQRVCRTTWWSKALSQLHFWGWQSMIVASIVTLVVWTPQGSELSEAQWLIDLAWFALWTIPFSINFAMTIQRRRVARLHVSMWFYIATVVVIGWVSLLNLLALPTSWTGSESVLAGTSQGAFQSWMQGNLLTFLLMAPFLGLMYHFVPVISRQPVPSYRLAIAHFWGLVVIAPWTAIQLSYWTPLPDWILSTGMLAGLLLWMPAWGGWLNGLRPLRKALKNSKNPNDDEYGDLDRLALRFLWVSVLSLGLVTLVNVATSIKSVHASVQYTDFLIANLHATTLGWNGMMVFGVVYWLVPRWFGRQWSSIAAIRLHFRLAVVGLLTYVVCLWVAGLAESHHWLGLDQDGQLIHPEFVEVLDAVKPYWWGRLIGGGCYAAGVLLMGGHLTWTLIRSTKSVGADPVWLPPPGAENESDVDEGEPVLVDAPVLESARRLAVGARMHWHRRWELSGTRFAFLVTLSSLFAAAVQLSPWWVSPDTWSQVSRASAAFEFESQDADEQNLADETGEETTSSDDGEVEDAAIEGGASDSEEAVSLVAFYTPLELMGRNVFLAEGCVHCHTQMVRPIVAETKRYGEFSLASDARQDRPTQWGTRRVGPDLAREGGVQTSLWHYQHLLDPRSVNANSVMPSFGHLIDSDLEDSKEIRRLERLRAMAGVRSESRDDIVASIQGQAERVAADIVSQGGPIRRGERMTLDSKVVALIAYLQRLGAAPTVTKTPAPGETVSLGAATINLVSIDRGSMRLTNENVRHAPTMVRSKQHDAVETEQFVSTKGLLKAGFRREFANREVTP
ncbi:MAG: cbb3-type cytochrome c oxidase subunit I [Planctomycetota bacterium]